MSPFARVPTLIGWTVNSAVGVVLVSQLVPTPGRIIAALQSLTPWTALVVLATAFAASLLRRDEIGFVAAGLSVVCLALMTPLAFARGTPEPLSGATPVTVITVNVLYSNDRIPAVTERLAEHAPDVVVITEVTPRIAAALEEQPFAEQYAHRLGRTGDRGTGLVVWSRFPVAEVHPVTGFRRLVDAILETPNGPLRVVAIHPPPPVVAPDVWSRELERLPEVIRGEPGRTVVLGDFNASWFHPPFRRMLDRADLTDALAADGRGLAMTWPADELLPPFVALDHILVSDGIAVVDTAVFDIPGADHRGVLAVVAPAAAGVSP